MIKLKRVRRGRWTISFNWRGKKYMEWGTLPECFRKFSLRKMYWLVRSSRIVRYELKKPLRGHSVFYSPADICKMKELAEGKKRGDLTYSFMTRKQFKERVANGS